MTHQLPPRPLIKEIKIKDMSEGSYFKEQLQRLVKDDNATVFMVAKFGYANDWFACCGWCSWDALTEECQTPNFKYYTENVREPSDVARFGDRLGEQEAREYFPEISKTVRYRA